VWNVGERIILENGGREDDVGSLSEGGVELRLYNWVAS
jgi:hypothetical protein